MSSVKDTLSFRCAFELPRGHEQVVGTQRLEQGVRVTSVGLGSKAMDKEEVTLGGCAEEEMSQDHVWGCSEHSKA